jgi:N-sulfoglucosamine sulfohydrolase
MTGDHGMPFPRCKSNLYDSGTRVPLVVRWPERFQPGRQVDDFVSLTDLAPTFLEAAGALIPVEMTGRSMLGMAAAETSGQSDPHRDHILFGKERHVPAQESPDMGGYPCRAIRTHGHLYVRNYHPERWPNGTPHYRRAAIPGSWYGDTDNGPTKAFMIANRDQNPELHRFYQLAFAKRPAEELYDLVQDPDQLRNVANERAYQKIKQRLAERLTARLVETGDPRATGSGDRFDEYPYLGGSPMHPILPAVPVVIDYYSVMLSG